jgi:hypothetical protein
MIHKGRYASFHDFLAAKIWPAGTLLAIPVLYAPIVLFVCLTPWARQRRPLWKTFLLANLVFAIVPALMFVLASRH